MEERAYYVLDRVEEGTAILLPLPGGEKRPAEAVSGCRDAIAAQQPPEEMAHGRKAQAGAVQLPVQALCACLPEGRPADGMLFYCSADGIWRPDPAAAALRQQLLQKRMQQLLKRGRERKK